MPAFTEPGHNFDIFERSVDVYNFLFFSKHNSTYSFLDTLVYCVCKCVATSENELSILRGYWAQLQPNTIMALSEALQFMLPNYKDQAFHAAQAFIKRIKRDCL